MCGIAGFWQLQGRDHQWLRDTAGLMASTMVHRGPDDDGAWADAEAGIALGHRRLAILDLSAAGHQPMLSSSGRYVLIFNGEIYNHLELRDAVSSAGGGPIAWRGRSDTETLLAAIEFWGLEATLRRAVGMFALGLWDRRRRTLQLARDRFGEKPLYYGWVGGREARAFAFASELKALRAYPGFASPVCRQALAQLLRFSYVPAPRSIYRGVYKLESGCLLTVCGSPPGSAPSKPLRPGNAFETLRVRRWWSLEVTMAPDGPSVPAHDGEAIDQLESRLDSAVRAQSLSDVPVGVFLSGGVDSSTVAALMQRQTKLAGAPPAKTFTIGFDEPGFDEAPHALAVARHLGTDHRELRVTGADALSVISQLPRIYDEPFADPSQIPTYLVSRAARQFVTVALTGDGGDELFGGYGRYLERPLLWSLIRWLPSPARRALGHLAMSIPVGAWDLLGAVLGTQHLGHKAHKLIERVMRVRSQGELFRSMASEWPEPALLVDGLAAAGGEPANIFDEAVPSPLRGILKSPQALMMWGDMHCYLPDDILCKVDRAAMAASLETRAPFLDHRVAQWAWSQPLHMKFRDGQGKWALRQVLYRHVPRELIERPKAGFTVPIGKWLRGPLRDWAEDLLSRDRLEASGMLQAGRIQCAWAEHVAGRRDWASRLWSILMFQAWLAEDSGSGRGLLIGHNQ